MPFFDTIGSLWRSTRTALGRAFLSTSATASDTGRRIPVLYDQGWDDLGNRCARYDLGEAMYENTMFSDIHAWARSYRTDFKLSPDIENIFNPTRKSVEFWSTHTYCGTTDPKAGDGKKTPSAIPIEAENDAVRIPIAKVFGDSQIDVIKSLLPRIGSMCGDVGLFAVNDPANRRTYLEVVHPRNVVKYVADATGVPQMYAIEEWWDDPRPNADPHAAKVIRREEGYLLRDESGAPVACKFKTYLGASGTYEAYDWDGLGTVWVEEYPFVPFILIPHVKVDQRSPFGQFEVGPLVPKINRIEDTASRLMASIGKTVDPVWLFKGVKPSDLELVLSEGRDKIPALAGGDNAGAQALVSSLNLADVLSVIKAMLEDIKEELPEIRKDIEYATGDSSGTALRVAQQRIETKAQARRAGYDHVVAKATEYCIRMGGKAGYPGYEGYDPASIAANPDIIRFRIAKRPVFQVSELDALLREKELLANGESADRQGIPILAYLALTGREAWIPVVEDAQKKALEMGLPVGRAKQASPVNDAAALAIQSPGGAAP